jgi:hypothetical protein
MGRCIIKTSGTTGLIFNIIAPPLDPPLANIPVPQWMRQPTFVTICFTGGGNRG